MIPLIFLSILMLLVFFLPVESGEKIGLAITVMLAFTIFLLLMDSLIPKTKDLPYISMYITTMMGVSTMSIVGSAMVLRIYHNDPGVRRIPYCASLSTVLSCKNYSECRLKL